MSEHKCLTCAWANWDRTKAGRLHPDGTGRCAYTVVLPKIPAAMYWSTWGREPRPPSGGAIDRRPNQHSFIAECPTWLPQEPQA